MGFCFSVLPFTVLHRVLFSCSSLHSFIWGLAFLFFLSQFYIGSCFPVLPFTALHRVLTFLCLSVLPFFISWVYGLLGFLFFPLWFDIGLWLSVLPFTVSQRVMTFCSSLHNFIAFHGYMVFWDSCSSLYGFIQRFGFLFFLLQFHRG